MHAQVGRSGRCLWLGWKEIVWVMEELKGNQWVGDLSCQGSLGMDGLSGSHGLCRGGVVQIQGRAPLLGH